ncbi:DNA mismatch repair protein MutH [Serratia symbiotica]|nr:DNA mismatch repair protein MutH [Serratia symbiotica]
MEFISQQLPPPNNEQELFSRAQSLAGCSLYELGNHAKLPIPQDLKHDKGWVGILLEQLLGAMSRNKPKQDFPALGIELKSIPINAAGKPLETTFVCVAPLTCNSGITWTNSHVRSKLARVLWVPVEGEQRIPLKQRRIGSPMLWSPNHAEEEMLRRDWEELMDLIVLGHIKQITARHGTVLQLRPKAANRKATTKAIDERGVPILTLPQGFYLKKNFTAALLARYFLV